MEYFDYKEYAAQRKAKAESQAREYFYHQKERKPYYCAEGNTLDEFNEAFFHFTDDEVARIKQLIIQTVNADQPEAEHVSTVDEAIDCLTYNEIFEQSEELRTLLGQRCDEANLDPNTIDFDTRHYFYKFSVLAFNYNDNKVCGPIPVEIILSDDDYITLLTLQLLDRDGFSFNHLISTHPELAAKLNRHVYCYQIPFNAPYAILFDELRADAEVIDGPEGATEQIYSKTTSEEIYHVYASAYSRILTVGEETMKDNALFAVQHQLEQINADAVMAALSAHDYRDMMQKLKEKFPTHSAFADIKAWLTATGITFKETESK